MGVLTMTASYYQSDSGIMNLVHDQSAVSSEGCHAHPGATGGGGVSGDSCPVQALPLLPSLSPAKNNDLTFEPTIDMMVNDFDDEQTLEEEEALAAKESEDPAEELSNLQKESEMPIEELLALYNIPQPVQSSVTNQENPLHELSGVESPAQTSVILDCGDKLDCGGEHQKEYYPEEDETCEDDADEPEDEEDEEDNKGPSKLQDLYPEAYGGKVKDEKRLLRARASDDEEDDDYIPDEDECRKTIMVGSEFQAAIPEGLKKYDDVLPYENEDKLLWDPHRLTEDEIENYLRWSHLAKKRNATGVEAVPCGAHLRDDEQALYLLLQCGYNAEEALRRKRINSVPATEQMTAWSEEECRNFESGIRVYGKDFYTIKQLKVKTRSVGELVQFYYIWKKTERHDIFANKARLEKKKYNLHPGITDFMDRFIDEQENNGIAIATNPVNRDRSSSPGGPPAAVANDICASSYPQDSEFLKRNQSKAFPTTSLPAVSFLANNGASSTNANLGHSKKTVRNKCSMVRSSPTATTIPQDPLDVGDIEVFSGITTNYIHKKLNSSRTNMICPSSDLDPNPIQSTQ